MTDGVSLKVKEIGWQQFALRHFVPFGWALVILWLSLTSTPPEVPGVFGWDKLLHAVAYGLLAFLVVQLLLVYDRNIIRSCILTSIVCILYGGLVEILQLLGNSGRTAEWWDLFADAVGIVLACVVFRHGYPVICKHASSKGQTDG
jgi:VanZ family protein